jgi:hypothetical protein
LRHQLGPVHVPPFQAAFRFGGAGGYPRGQTCGSGDHLEVPVSNAVCWIARGSHFPLLVLGQRGVADGRSPMAPPAIGSVVMSPGAQPVGVSEIREIIQLFLFAWEQSKLGRQSHPRKCDVRLSKGSSGGAGERANGRGQAGKWGNKGLALAVVKFPSLMPERSLMIATRQSMVAPCNFWNVIANAAWTSKTFARMGLASTSAPSALVRCSGARLKNACQCGISGSVLGGALIYGAASMENGGGRLTSMGPLENLARNGTTTLHSSRFGPFASSSWNLTLM